jgi:serine/threonine protein kinase
MEMWLGRPLFPGDSEIDQILRIFRVLGTPTEETWPGVSQLPDFKASFPLWAPGALFPPLAPELLLEPAGLDLLRRTFLFDPAVRVTAKQALEHPFFAEQH